MTEFNRRNVLAGGAAAVAVTGNAEAKIGRTPIFSVAK